MELAFSSFSILFASFLFVYMVLKIREKSKTGGGSLNLPPGPWKLPLIGNLHQLVCSLPHQQLRDLSKKYGPLMHLQLGQLSTIIVSSPEYAKEVMQTHDVIFASRPFSLPGNTLAYNSTDILFSPYGDYWRQIRKICLSNLFSLKRVQSFRLIREEEVSNLINWIGSKEGLQVNLTDRIYSLSDGITSRAAFGKKRKYEQPLLLVVKETMELLGGFNISDLFPSISMLQSISGFKSQLEKLHEETDRILENIINDHIKGDATSEIGNKNEENEDLVDVLLKVQKDGNAEFRLTTDNIKAIIWDIFIAGTGTATTTINWAMSELMKNQRLMKKAQVEVREVFNRKGMVDETCINEMKFLKVIVKETLRLHPPGPLLAPRESREACKIKGFEIPIKTKVIVNGWAIGRDPEYWIEPESFVPERFFDSPIDYNGNCFEYIPFGAGRRKCPGMSFGLSIVELSLAMLLYHFDWQLPSGIKPEALNMAEVFGLTVGRKDDLFVIPIPYRPSSTIPN